MSKIRDKLRALHAPRPTELPEGLEVAPMLAPGAGSADSAPAPQKPAPQKPAPRKPAPRKPAPQEPPPTRPHRPAPAPAPPRREPGADEARRPPAERDVELRGTEALPPRFAGAERATASATDAERSAGVPHRNTLPRADRVVVRRSDFERWRRNRRADALDEEATDPESSPADAPAPPPTGSTASPDAERLVLERRPAGPVSAHDHLMAAKIAWTANRVARSVTLLERALDLGLDGRERFAALRTLAEAYISLERDEDARIALEELVEVESPDPFPFVVLADLVADDDPERAAKLRARARAIAPWMG